MLVSASTDCFPGAPLDEAVSRLADLEFSRVEISIRAEGGCLVDFSVSFSFRNALFESLAGKYFDKAFRKMVAAFEERAVQLYGNSSSSAINAA